MAAPKRHKFNQFNTEYPGRERKYKNSRELWKAIVSYFEWVENNPLVEQKCLVVDKTIEFVEVDKVRATSVAALCRHLGIWVSNWHKWKAMEDDYRMVCVTAEEMIRDQKFTCAAANLLNSTLISRDLGLADKRELSGPEGNPIEMVTNDMTPQEAAEAYADTLNN
mgnify:CR=1 FL=1